MSESEHPSPAGVPKPRQKRSRETLRRILDAFEGALEAKTFEEVTVQDICAAAQCSVGTFYGRVESKERTLDLLRDRVYAEIQAQLPVVFDPEVAQSRPLLETLRAQCRLLVGLHAQRRGVIRALIVQARRRSEFARYTRTFNDAMLRRVAETWAARPEEIVHANPRVAAEQAALMAAGYLRESVVFDELWPTPHRLDEPARSETLFRMVASYLTGTAPSEADSSS